MKKLNYFVMAMIVVFAMSCKNDTEEPPAVGDPTVTAPASATAVVVGENVTIDFSVTAPGNVATVTATASAGTAVTISPNPIIGQTSGIVTVTYTAPLVDGPQTVTLTVTDAQATPKTASAIANVDVTLGPTSTSELLVAKFASAPTLDGEIDDMWNVSQRLISTAAVPSLSPRRTYLNSDGEGVEEGLGLFAPFANEEENFTMRSGYFGEDIYFLLEWDDAVDSKDRQSWFFDETDSRWKQEHKYANTEDDKFYEDKFAFLFPIGEVTGFAAQTCWASCHGPALDIAKAKDKHTRHYLETDGEKIDMWHWKRVRGTHNDRVDDQRISYVAPDYTSSSNGRSGDADGQSGYSDNKQTLTITGTAIEVSVPKYVVPDATDYYWIPEEDFGVAAKLVTAVDADGILTYDGGTIVPAGDAGYNQGTGNKRFPSVTTRDFTGGRADITIKVNHTGSGWIAEFTRKLNTSDPDDVVFNPAEELPFGFAIFNNAAIAHAIKPGLNMKFEQ